MSTPFKIVNFYNSGAQVVVKGQPAGRVDMARTFTVTKGKATPDREIGYEPKPNSKLAKGAAYDELEHRGTRHLLLKGGHVYHVVIDGEQHVISAEDGHLSLPVRKNATVEVEEYDADLHGQDNDNDGEGSEDDGAADEEE